MQRFVLIRYLVSLRVHTLDIDLKLNQSSELSNLFPSLFFTFSFYFFPLMEIDSSDAFKSRKLKIL